MKKADGNDVDQIGFKREIYYLGTFEEFEDAKAACKRAEQIPYGDFMEHFEKDMKESYEAEAAIEKEAALK